MIYFIFWQVWHQSLIILPFIIDDTMLGENSVRMQGISRFFDNVRGRCVLGYKLLLRTSFDSKTTIPFDFSLHQEKGKKETKL